MQRPRTGEAQPGPPAQAAIRLHPDDNVAVALQEFAAGCCVPVDAGQTIEARQAIPAGHKLALAAIEPGEVVFRYGQPIGRATQRILPGEHVHTHNLGLGSLEGWQVGEPRLQPAATLRTEGRTFLGYRRDDGRVGTRNYVAVIATVNCAAHVAREIARHFTPRRLARLAHVDGVAAFVHNTGCTFRAGSPEHVLLRNTLAGIARHPNVGGYLLVGLGCETNQVGDLAALCGLPAGSGRALVIQERGGIRKTVAAGIAAVEDMLPRLDAARRTPQPLSELVLALQCGGSDGWSGVTANPVVGRLADAVVAAGGAAVLAETPEIVGAEHLLSHRAARPEVAEALLAQVRWWEAHAAGLGLLVDDNRSAGNEAGGLTTIYEKSLGAVAKGGTAPLAAVVDYAEPVAARGLVFMNSPGYDPASVTGQVAGGCNLVLFTTGRGSVFGGKPAPVIKIASNSATFRRMVDDMDLDAGRVLAGAGLEQVAAELLDMVVDVASGRPSKSEAQGVGEAEFCPWTLGAML